MKYSFHPSARTELNDSINYYEDCHQGLGLEFAEEVYSTIQRILWFPEAWSRLSLNSRRCLTNRFPYGIIYQVLEDEISIVAVMQLNRKPDYWKDRVGKR
ncbi:type II toxin-antitoxin system RelE/ParE family toxin [bacterium]|nr:type II toxin-antitoxin system RelE/ParE family toxin [bacterium]MBU1753157.1 type II toxin-antitoxin system RelE/ParE family toxin [bacterium]